MFSVERMPPDLVALNEPWKIGVTELWQPYDLVRMYCGLPWMAFGRVEAPEHWGFDFYDAVPPPRREFELSPTDVLAACALGGSLKPAHLRWFADTGMDLISDWCRRIPRGARLEAEDHELVSYVGGLNNLTDAVPLALLTRVAHRIRPDAIPLYDSETASLYRVRTGGRGEGSWPSLVHELAHDASETVNPGLERVWRQVAGDLLVRPSRSRGKGGPAPRERPLSKLRVLSIGISMGNALGFPEEQRLPRLREHLERVEIERRFDTLAQGRRGGSLPGEWPRPE